MTHPIVKAPWAIIRYDIFNPTSALNKKGGSPEAHNLHAERASAFVPQPYAVRCLCTHSALTAGYYMIAACGARLSPDSRAAGNEEAAARTWTQRMSGWVTRAPWRARRLPARTL